LRVSWARRWVYETAFVARCYYYALDRSKCGAQFAKIRKIWENRDVVVVEGERTHNGVGNDLLDTARSVERIICPPSDAYGAVPAILDACTAYGKDRLFLLSVGVAAKFLAVELFERGYRVLDIGNLDMEYEWFVRRAPGKMKLEKHEAVSEEANRAAGYTAYLEQIKVRVYHAL
ncbi:MAG: GT-D fold domain-containing protein, partial [Lachnospiraceae bacterium]|nr:GT-D fold domain-containing protein [Lachnospiraceae bacterium]